MMMSFRIDSREGQYVGVAHLLGEFLHGYMEENVHMLQEGTISKLIVRREPNLDRNFYVKINKENPCCRWNSRKLYMGPKSTLRSWRPFWDTLIEWGFKLNKYDKCMVNKTVNGKQCKIICSVDDLKYHMWNKVWQHKQNQQKLGEYSTLYKQRKETRISRHETRLQYVRMNKGFI